MAAGAARRARPGGVSALSEIRGLSGEDDEIIDWNYHPLESAIFKLSDAAGILIGGVESGSVARADALRAWRDIRRAHRAHLADYRRAMREANDAVRRGLGAAGGRRAGGGAAEK